MKENDRVREREMQVDIDADKLTFIFFSYLFAVIGLAQSDRRLQDNYFLYSLHFLCLFFLNFIIEK